MHQRFVRIVAGETGQARVAVFAPAFAGFEAIGLEADGESSGDAGHGYVPLGAVARAAEFDGLYGAERVRIED